MQEQKQPWARKMKTSLKLMYYQIISQQNRDGENIVSLTSENSCSTC